MPQLLATVSIAVFTIVMTVHSRAAAIVKVTYSQNGNSIARMIYTGSDGGADSDRANYWKLLGKAPEGAYEVKIKPDRPGGKTATLVGKIAVSIEIRNKFNMGTAKTEKLTLVRDDTSSDRWYIPTKELKRMTALIDKKSAKIDRKVEQEIAGRVTPTTGGKSDGKKKP